MTLKTRIIPCLLLRNGLIVRSEEFRYHQIIGDPTTQLSRYDQWMVDELIYIDISEDEQYDVRRADAQIATAAKTDVLDIISEISRHCFVPLTIGGKIRSLNDMRRRFASGADKITINTLAIERPEAITEAADAFGSQAIVVSIDAKRLSDGRCVVYKGGRSPTELDPAQWAAEAAKRGAGEILLNSIDRDGRANGYDIDLVHRVTDATTVPVIALGGCGQWSDMVAVLRDGHADAAAAANIFHFTEMSYKAAKRHLRDSGINVRMPYPETDAPRRFRPRQVSV